MHYIGNRQMHRQIHTHALVHRCHACQNSFLSHNLSGITFKNLCLSCKHRICKSSYQPKAHTQFTLLPKFPFVVAPATGCTVLYMYCRRKQCTIFNADIDSSFLITFNFSFSSTKGGNVYIYMKLKSCSLMQMMRERRMCQGSFLLLCKENGQNSSGWKFAAYEKEKKMLCLGEVVLTRVCGWKQQCQDFPIQPTFYSGCKRKKEQGIIYMA